MNNLILTVSLNVILLVVLNALVIHSPVLGVCLMVIAGVNFGVVIGRGLKK